MKLNLTLLSLITMVATGSIAVARTNGPTADGNSPAVTNSTPAAPADNTAVATTPATNTTVTTVTTVTTTPVAADTNAPAPTTVAASPTPVVTASVVVVAPPAPVDVPRDPNAVIPLIVMDEVPLTDAIKNLARQANLNYMLDPKINYGAPGPDGQIKAQPVVSFRWENLTADQALTAVLNGYNMVIIDDPKTRISRITIKDPAAPEPLVTKIIQLKYSDASNMVANVQSVLVDKRSKVIADSRTSQLVLIATDKEVVDVDQLVARLDTQTKEVLIEAKLVELQKNPSTTKGVDWSGTLQAQHINFGNGTAYLIPPTAGTPASPGVAPTYTQISGSGGISNVFSSGTPPTGATPGTGGLISQVLSPGQIPMIQANSKSGFNPSTFFLNADGVSAVLSFLNTEADAKVLSTPRAVTLDNQEATLSVTTAQPIFKTTAGTQGSPGGAEVTYTNLGTILKVTPRISANNTINLRVIPEVSSLGGTITKTVSGLVSQADFFDVRKIDTHVLIPSGNTLVMGGLVSDSSSKGNTKVPLLGDIPGLGWAFRSESKTQNKRNLIIFITPTIVQNEDFQPTETAFLKTKLPDAKTADFGAWDSGNPQDWSKLMHSKKKAGEDTTYDDISTTK